MVEEMVEEKYVNELADVLVGRLEDAKSYVNDALEHADEVYADPAYYAETPKELLEKLRKIKFWVEEAISELEIVLDEVTEANEKVGGVEVF